MSTVHAYPVNGLVLYDQEFTVGDGSGRTGDCLRAAIATLLQIPCDRVPHFGEFSDWVAAVQCFRDGLEFRWPQPSRPLFPAVDADGGMVVGCGRSPRGHMHAVLMSATDGMIVHDPHPSRDGLAGDVEYLILLRTPGSKRFPCPRWPWTQE